MSFMMIRKAVSPGQAGPVCQECPLCALGGCWPVLNVQNHLYAAPAPPPAELSPNPIFFLQRFGLKPGRKGESNLTWASHTSSRFFTQLLHPKTFTHTHTALPKHLEGFRTVSRDWE